MTTPTYHDGTKIQAGDYFETFSGSTIYEVISVSVVPSEERVCFTLKMYDRRFKLLKTTFHTNYSTHSFPIRWTKVRRKRNDEARSGFGKFIRENNL